MLPRPRAMVLIALLLVLPVLAAAARPLDFDGPGPYAVGYTTFEVHDEHRSRTLPVSVWYPVRPAEAEGSPRAVYGFLFFDLESPTAVAGVPVVRHGFFPLIVFSHGNGGIAIQSFFLTERLASHGFVVVAPDHVGDTLLDAVLSGIGDAEMIQSAIDRPRDVSLLIDTMAERTLTPSDPFFFAVNPLRVGVVGHSFGGFTALAVAGGFRAEAADAFGIEVPEGFEPYRPDWRVRAIVPIAPASTPLGDGELAGVRVPTLLVGGTLDHTTPLVPEVTRPFETVQGRPLYRADLHGAAHYSFTDACTLIQVALDGGLPRSMIEDLADAVDEEGCSSDVLPVEEAHRLTNLVTVAFLRRHLAGDWRAEHALDPARLERREPDLDFFRRPPKRAPWLRWWMPGRHW